MEEKIERVNQQIEGVEAKIEQVEQAIANAEAEWRKGGPHEGIWLKREEDLRKEKGRLQDKENQLRELLLRITPPADPQSESVRDEEFARMQVAVADLQLKVYTSTRTSKTDADLGKFWRAKANKIKDVPFLATVPNDTLDEVVEAVLKKFPDKKLTGFEYVKSPKADEDEAGPSTSSNKKRKGTDPPSPNPPRLPGYTLADCIPAARSPKFKEDTHMQPAAIKMIQAAVEVLKAKFIVRDTHSSSHQFIHPVGRPDVSLLAAALVAWTQLVSVGELKVGGGTDELDSMFGQLISRATAILENQPDRQRVISFGLTMNSIEIVLVQRGQDKSWVVQSTGSLPFSISSASVGFRFLVRLLATDFSDLGFIEPETPVVHSLEGREVSNLELLRRGELRAVQGTVLNSVGSVVFKASTPGYDDCILKLCHTSHEGTVLSRLEENQVLQVVKLLARGNCTYNDRQWEALLLVPFAVRLTQALPVQTLVQVTLDIAHAIDQCLEVGVAHRDITLDNIGIVNGRGVLYDFSAAKFTDPKERDEAEVASPSGMLEAITGTSLYAALSVLEGRSHTTSSMLEGLYLSILAVCCDEKLTGRHDMKIADLQKCQIIRRGSMLAPLPPDFCKVPSTHLGFVRDMHELFYPLQVGLYARMYNAEVSLDEFEMVCKKWIEQ